MTTMFHVLASGSSGNASVLDVGGFGILLDFGLGPRQLAKRFDACGLSWDHIHAVVLTHTHGDHWQAETLAELARRRIPLYCHTEHVSALRGASDAFADVLAAGLLSCYDIGRPWSIAAGCRCRAFPLRHDDPATCGFRFAGPEHSLGSSWALAYAADLGCWDAELVEHLADVDVLAVEFNHDSDMQRTSKRPYSLIRRVLGDRGHLSNSQGADLVRAVLEQSEPGRLQHVVQLHLSRQCNRPELARAAAQGVAAEMDHSFRIHTARQDRPGPSLTLAATRRRPRRVLASLFVQMRLPGWD